MTEQQVPHIIPFAGLLEELKMLGFKPGVDTYLRLNTLLNRWEHIPINQSAKSEARLQALKIQLAALLAQNAEQQQQLYDYFDAFVRRYQPIPAAIYQEKVPARNYWGLGTSLFVGIGALIALWMGWMNMQRGTFEARVDWHQQPFTQSIWLTDESSLYQSPFFQDSLLDRSWIMQYFQADSLFRDTLASKAASVRWDAPIAGNVEVILSLQSNVPGKDTLITKQMMVEKAIPIVLGASPTGEAAFHFHLQDNPLKEPTGYPLTEIYGNTSPEFVGDIPFPSNRLFDRFERQLRIEGKLGDGNTLKDTSVEVNFVGPVFQFDHSYQTAGEYKVDLRVQQVWTFKETGAVVRMDQESFALSVVVEAPNPIEAVPIPDLILVKEDLTDLLLPLERDYTPWFLVLAFALLYLMWELWRWFLKAPAVDRKASSRPPAWKELKIDRPEVTLFRTKEFGQAARMLRRQRQTASEELDLPKSLDATIQNGGFPQLNWRADKQTAQYLFLIERESKEDQQAFYFEELAEEFRQRDISVISLFYHPERPQYCYQQWEERTNLYDIGQLSTRLGNYRLIVIGTGEGWMQVERGTAKKEMKAFQNWKERVWLSTRPTESWGLIEYELSSECVVLPANVSSLSYVVPQWEGAVEQLPLQYWTRHTYDVEPPQEIDADSMADLYVYLGEKGFECLCCCAVYPELYWELTLTFGSMVGLQFQSPSEVQVLTRLLRLPWFRTGQMPQEVRLALFQQLSPSRLREVRAYLISILEAPHNQDDPSLAQARQQSLLAIYQYENSEKKSLDKESLKATLNRTNPKRIKDVISLKQLREIGTNPLSIPLPNRFYQYGLPLFGTKWWVRHVGALIVLLALLGTYFAIHPESLVQSEREEPFHEEWLTLTSARDSARWANYQGYWMATDSIRRGPAESLVEVDLYQQASNPSTMADDFFRQAIMIDSTYSSAIYNHAAHGFNVANTHYGEERYDVAHELWGSCCEDTLFAEAALYALGLEAMVSSRAESHLEGLGYNPIFEGSSTDKLTGLFRSNASSSIQAATQADIYLDGLSSYGIMSLFTLGSAYYSDTSAFSLYLKSPMEDQNLLAQNLDEIASLSPALLASITLIKSWMGIPISDSALLAITDPLEDIQSEVNNDTAGDDRVAVGASEEDLSSIAQDTRDIPTEITDSIVFEGYVGWQEEQRIPVTGARVKLSEVRTQLETQLRTDESGYFYIALSSKNPKADFRLNIESPSFQSITSTISGLSLFRQNSDTVRMVFRMAFDAQPPTEQVYIRAGNFDMGSTDGDDDESPIRVVSISDFSMDQYEVRVDQYMAFVQQTGSGLPAWLDRNHKDYLFYPQSESEANPYRILGNALTTPDYPIVGVSWEDALAYSRWLSKRTGLKYRLPTEAEWEYAANGGANGNSQLVNRAGVQIYDSDTYAGSNSVDEVAWHRANANGSTHVVGSKQPNYLGLYDMSGNVFEWCQDWYGPYEEEPKSAAISNPQGASYGDFRILRGGSWSVDVSFSRTTNRYFAAPTSSANDIGFRLVTDR